MKVFLKKKLLLAALLSIILFCMAVTFVYQNGAHTERLVSLCLQEEEIYTRSKCLSPYFKELTQREDAQHALEEAIQFQKEGIIDDCHLSAHEIGEANYEKFKGDTARAFSSCAMGCIEGCYHGVMEKFIETKGGTDAVVAEISELCSDIGTDMLLRRQCVHGVGHGLLLHDTDDLFIAIAQCEKMSSTSDSHICNGGVLMEYVHNYLTLPDEEFERIVPSVCGRVQAERNDLYPLCLYNLGEGLMFATGHDVEKSKSLCLLLEAEDRGRCLEGVQEEMDTHKKSED